MSAIIAKILRESGAAVNVFRAFVTLSEGACRVH